MIKSKKFFRVFLIVIILLHSLIWTALERTAYRQMHNNIADIMMILTLAPIVRIGADIVREDNKEQN